MAINDWKSFLMPYEQAVDELKVKLRSIRKEYRKRKEYSPIEFVTGRVKEVSSILEKANKFGIPVDRIRFEMEDIAGIRVMCQFVDDIDKVVELIRERQDMQVLYEKDYVRGVKSSGYRSYHVIIKYTVNMVDGPLDILAEFQIRTLAMNFWATIEHSLKYKYEHYIPEDVAKRLRSAADAAFLLDQEMGQIREEIMKAQVMYQAKSITIREVLGKIQELYDLGEISRAINYQRRLDRIDSQKDIKEIVALKEEIEEILQYYKNTRIDD